MKRILSSAATIILVAVTVFAQGPGQPGPGQRHGRQQREMGHGGPMASQRLIRAIFRQLDLTEVQKTQIEEIRSRNFAATQGTREQLRAERKSMKPADLNAPFDEQAFRAHALKMANLRVELEVAGAKTMNEIINVLTPDQKAKLQELRTKARERIKERFGA